jgi:uncharacterized peroxidase-related enzyme
MSFIKSLGKNAMLSDVFRHNWKKAGYLIGIAEEICLGQSELSRAELEVLEAYCSKLNECQYCYQLHNEVAQVYGEEGGLVAALFDDIDTAPTNDKMKALAHYLKGLTLEPHKITQTAVNSVLASGCSEKALADVIYLCSLSAMLNRLVFGFGIEGEGSQFTQVAQGVKDTGYRKMYEDMGLNVPKFTEA